MSVSSFPSLYPIAASGEDRLLERRKKGDTRCEWPFCHYTSVALWITTCRGSQSRVLRYLTHHRLLWFQNLFTFHPTVPLSLFNVVSQVIPSLISQPPPRPNCIVFSLWCSKFGINNNLLHLSSRNVQTAELQRSKINLDSRGLVASDGGTIAKGIEGRCGSLQIEFYTLK